MNVTQAVLTLLLAAITGTGASLVGAYFQRPKTRAEAQQTTVAAEVSMSADARAWVAQAMDRVRAAEVRADAAEVKADRAERRMEEIERASTAATRLLTRRVAQLEKALSEHDIAVPPPEG